MFRLANIGLHKCRINIGATMPHAALPRIPRPVSQSLNHVHYHLRSSHPHRPPPSILFGEPLTNPPIFHTHPQILLRLRRNQPQPKMSRTVSPSRRPVRGMDAVAEGLHLDWRLRGYTSVREMSQAYAQLYCLPQYSQGRISSSNHGLA